MRKTYKAYAKLNLHLDITGRLPNGYHSVAMLMQSVDLADTVTVEPRRTRGLELVCDIPWIPTDSRNLAWKAAAAFFGKQLPGLRITIQKKIPSGAGMAGGSADAAAVLMALRELFAPQLPHEQLSRMAAQVGADVPFCLWGGCCWAQGIGELLTPLQRLPPAYRFAIVKPQMHVNTGAAYAKLDAAPLQRPATDQVLRHAQEPDWPAAFPLCANVFEQAIAIPGLAQAKHTCAKAGALLTQMTGSGSAVFALYGPEANAKKIMRALTLLGGELHVVCKPVPCGVQELLVQRA
jgi:4-diphosphocytidyl-2-C-methyl-D-erythritol kinase